MLNTDKYKNKIQIQSYNLMIVLMRLIDLTI